MITLDKCDWLDRKHTIFGKITGDTIFNVLRMGDVEVGTNDRPLDPIKLLSIEILWNPFDDILPRAMVSKKESLGNKSIDSKTQKKGIRNSKLLSFEDEEENNNEQVFKKHSIHESKIVNESKLKAQVAPELQELLVSTTSAASDMSSGSGVGTADRLRSMMQEKSAQSRLRRGVPPKQVPTEDVVDQEDVEEVQDVGRMSVQATQEQRLKEEIHKSRRAVKVLLGQVGEKEEKDREKHNMSTAVEAMRLKYKKRKAEYGDRQNETLDKLQAFSAGLKASKAVVIEKEAPVYSGQVLEDGDEDGDEPIEGWHQGKLKFKKHIDDALRMGSDGRKLDDIVVIDPRKGP
jgi:peptidyl-prolyl cis-trans isomerase SDCCAG10